MSTPSHKLHKEKGQIAVGCGVITASDTRTEETDTSGQMIREMLAAAGHRSIAYHIVPDDPTRIRPLLDSLLGNGEIDAVLINGGAFGPDQ